MNIQISTSSPRYLEKNLHVPTCNDDSSSFERIVITDIKLGRAFRSRTQRRQGGATTRRRVSEVSAASIESALSAMFTETARSIYDEEEMDLGAMLKDLSI